MMATQKAEALFDFEPTAEVELKMQVLLPCTSDTCQQSFDLVSNSRRKQWGSLLA